MIRLRALLQPYVDEYSLDEQGRIGKVEWVKGLIRMGKRNIRQFSNISAILHPGRYVKYSKTQEMGLQRDTWSFRAFSRAGLPSDLVRSPSWTFQGKTPGLASSGDLRCIKPNREKDLGYAINLMTKGIPD